MGHEECRLLYFGDSSFVFHPNELNLFSKYSPFEALQSILFLLSKIISITLRYVIESINLRCTTFKDNLLTNPSNHSMTGVFFDVILSQLTAQTSSSQIEYSRGFQSELFRGQRSLSMNDGKLSLHHCCLRRWI